MYSKNDRRTFVCSVRNTTASSHNRILILIRKAPRLQGPPVRLQYSPITSILQLIIEIIPDPAAIMLAACMLATQTNREEWIERAQLCSFVARNGKLPFVKEAPLLHFKCEAERYSRAAEAYYICSSWVDASRCYERAADVWGRQPLKCHNEAASLYTKAATALKKVRPLNSTKLYDRARAEFCAVEKYDLAGRAEEEKAMLNESEGKMETAIACYQCAAKSYMADGSHHLASIVLQKAAHIMGCSVGDSEKAALLYEELGRRKLENNLTKSDACNDFFKMGILLLATGPTHYAVLEEKLLELASIDNVFEKSRQCAFLQHTMTSVGAGDLDLFADHVHSYDLVSELDGWELDLLDTVRQNIEKHVEQG